MRFTRRTAMAENKTQPTKVPLEKFLATVTPEVRRDLARKEGDQD